MAPVRNAEGQPSRKKLTMRIAPYERVVYDHNPLAEVLCQVRFDRMDLEEQSCAGFHRAVVESGYPVVWTEEGAEITVHFGGAEASEVRRESPARVHHFASEDHALRISHSSEFVALTCTRYVSWADYKPRMLHAMSLLSTHLGVGKPVRVGLRYKDVVEREPIGITGTPWRELLSPFVLGPLGANDLCAGGTVPEGDVMSFAFQSNIRLDDCCLLLQGGLLTSVDGSRTAYLVDSDFYVEGEAAVGAAEPEALDELLERLHVNAGALFRRTITGRLHDALRPKTAA